MHAMQMSGFLWSGCLFIKQSRHHFATNLQTGSSTRHRLDPDLTSGAESDTSPTTRNPPRSGIKGYCRDSDLSWRGHGDSSQQETGSLTIDTAAVKASAHSPASQNLMPLDPFIKSRQLDPHMTRMKQVFPAFSHTDLGATWSTEAVVGYSAPSEQQRRERAPDFPSATHSSLYASTVFDRLRSGRPKPSYGYRFPSQSSDITHTVFTRSASAIPTCLPLASIPVRKVKHMSVYSFRSRQANELTLPPIQKRKAEFPAAPDHTKKIAVGHGSGPRGVPVGISRVSWPRARLASAVQNGAMQSENSSIADAPSTAVDGSETANNYAPMTEPTVEGAPPISSFDNSTAAVFANSTPSSLTSSTLLAHSTPVEHEAPDVGISMAIDTPDPDVPAGGDSPIPLVPTNNGNDFDEAAVRGAEDKHVAELRRLRMEILEKDFTIDSLRRKLAQASQIAQELLGLAEY
ncbi:hypothetical protein BV25DRAFT_1843073 [Artomyces pyxidatus]|uniref:Uncharacterized protein n=1 Tax=Artomyces pyxidatus TaxID=48021 RepID=A0ACB8SFX4_9AGAM|nr:hypothetical protein BV25DRAFT_1843073 [Artomyces pyxidatus]